MTARMTAVFEANLNSTTPSLRDRGALARAFEYAGVDNFSEPGNSTIRATMTLGQAQAVADLYGPLTLLGSEKSDAPVIHGTAHQIASLIAK